MKKKQFAFSILIPTYNGGDTIKNTLLSVMKQDYSNFEVIVNDDCSTDDTITKVQSYKDKRIKIFHNKKNLGYPGNLNSCLNHAKGDIVYLLGQDDILASNALTLTNNAFNLSEDIGAVARPYRWFDRDFNQTIRLKYGLGTGHDEVVRITDDVKRVATVFRTLDSLSALAYRRAFLDRPFHEDIFPCHVYPFASIFKKHPIVFLNEYVSSVSVKISQTLFVSSIYDKSPLLSWVQMFENIFPEKNFKSMRKYCIRDFVAVNYVGLAQIKNYSRYPYVYTARECYYLIKYNPRNLITPQFWFFAIGALITPRALLTRMIRWYKQHVNTKRFDDIPFTHSFTKQEMAAF
jgi:glycosyltransferase involved in cell wall biosynthesis